MTADMLALARRAVACKGFRWMPGMLTSHGARYLGFDLWVDRGQRVAVFADPDEGEVPDLTDPATLGCLLALVREAMNDPNACVCWSLSDDLWMCEAKHEYEGKTYLGLFAQASTYAGSLVAALEAAP